jgi:hypothetical protein
MAFPCQVPAIATVRSRIDYARNEAALLCRFAQSITGLCKLPANAKGWGRE